MSLMAMKAYSAEFKADAVALYLSDPSHTEYPHYPIKVA
jgi:transposase